MDDTLKKITELLSRRRAELRDHFKHSEVWESTTEDLLNRVQQLRTKLEASMDGTADRKRE
jgi:hypothetical protein